MRDLAPLGIRTRTVRSRLACAVAIGVAIPLTTAASFAQAGSRNEIAGGYRLYPAPAAMRRQCERAQQHVRFVVLCPTVMPRTGDGATSATASPLPSGDAGVVPKTFAEWGDYPKQGISSWLYVGGVYGGGETDPSDWADNNPNFFFHFFVDEGQLSARSLNLVGVSHPQHYLGTRTIAGHHGRLYDQVSYSLCSDCSFTGHVTFIWHVRGITYAASLHRWSVIPDHSVLAVLAALVKGLRPAR